MCFGTKNKYEDSEDEKTDVSDENSQRIKSRILDFDNAKKYRKESHESTETPVTKFLKEKPKGDRKKKQTEKVGKGKKLDDPTKPVLKLTTPESERESFRILPIHGDRNGPNSPKNSPANSSKNSNKKAERRASSTSKSSQESLLNVPKQSTSNRNSKRSSQTKHRKKSSDSQVSNPSSSEIIKNRQESDGDSEEIIKVQSQKGDRQELQKDSDRILQSKSQKANPQESQSESDDIVKVQEVEKFDRESNRISKTKLQKENLQEFEKESDRNSKSTSQKQNQQEFERESDRNSKAKSQTQNQQEFERESDRISKQKSLKQNQQEIEKESNRISKAKSQRPNQQEFEREPDRISKVKSQKPSQQEFEKEPDRISKAKLQKGDPQEFEKESGRYLKATAQNEDSVNYQSKTQNGDNVRMPRGSIIKDEPCYDTENRIPSTADNRPKVDMYNGNGYSVIQQLNKSPQFNIPKDNIVYHILPIVIEKKPAEMSAEEHSAVFDESRKWIPNCISKNGNTAIQREQHICVIFLPSYKSPEEKNKDPSQLYTKDDLIPTISPAKDVTDCKNDEKRWSIMKRHCPS